MDPPGRPMMLRANGTYVILSAMNKGRKEYPFAHLSDQRYGRWTVLARHISHERTIKWLCRCECGTHGIVHGGNLKSGRSKSCGCLNKEVAFATATARWRGRRKNSNPLGRYPFD